MNILNEVFLLVFLFIVLGFLADQVVKNIKLITLTLKIKLFAVGIILGVITTLPEFSIGINAITEGVGSISVGNLLGGIVVIVGLVLGLSLLLNRKVETDSSVKSLIPSAVVILFAVLLGFDGSYTLFDGIIMVISYIFLILYLYYINFSLGKESLIKIEKKKIIKAFLFSIIGVALIMLVSNSIIDTAINLLGNLNISKFVIGLMVFSVGTNLPEIVIAFTSWRQKASELSLSHLISSAFTNIFILGTLVIIKPINFTINTSYYTTALFIFISLVSLVFFGYSGRKLDRKEGVILLGIYILFLVVTIFFGLQMS